MVCSLYTWFTSHEIQSVTENIDPNFQLNSKSSSNELLEGHLLQPQIPFNYSLISIENVQMIAFSKS